MTDFNYNFDFQPTPWMRHAACRNQPTKLFFPERGDPVDEAKAICATCPVRQDCYDYSLTIPNLVGIWGGSSGRERRETKSRQRPIRHGTPTGYNQHRRRGEPACPLCRQANTEATRNRQK
jgi:WhiB family redox-sensing transcriptional regulator